MKNKKTEDILPLVADYKYQTNRDAWFIKYYNVKEKDITEKMIEDKKIDISNCHDKDQTKQN